MNKINKLLFALLAIVLASCETNEIIDSESFEDSQKLLLIPNEDLNGWEIGYCLEDKYVVAYHDETDNSLVTMINKSGEDADKGLILVFNEEQEIASVGTMEKLYDVSFEDNNIILYRINEDGFYEEEIIPISQARNQFENARRRAPSAGDVWNLVSKGADFIGNIQSGHAIGSDVLNWDWGQLGRDIGDLGIGFVASKVHPVLGFIYTVGQWPVAHYRKQDEERKRTAMYGDCEISIDEIRPENGNCIIYATVRNANKLHDYLVNMYDRTENEKTRNLVSCGIAVRVHNEHVTTHIYDYKSQETQLNGEVRYGSVANFSFTISGLDLTKNLSTYYFRPYLTSTRIRTKRGDVAEGHIKYGKTVPYQAFNGKIKEFKQYDAQYSTDNNKYGFVMFRTTVNATISNLDNLEEWGIYVYDLNGSGLYDYYPSEYRAAKLEDWIDIDFNINKNEFDEINKEYFFASKKVKVGLYQKLKNPTGNYDYMSYFYSEPQEYELTYSEKPSLSFTYTQFKSTEPYTEPNDHNWDTQSYFSVKYDVQGAFFIDKLVQVLWGNWLNPGKTDMSDYYIYDGEHETNYGIIYTKPGSGTTYRSIELVCGGNIIYSDNYLQYISDGTQYSTLQIIGGSPSYSRRRASRNEASHSPNGIPLGK